MLSMKSFIDKEVFSKLQEDISLLDVILSSIDIECTKSNWTFRPTEDESGERFIITQPTIFPEDAIFPGKYLEPLPKDIQQRVYDTLELIFKENIFGEGYYRSHIELQFTPPGKFWKPHYHKDHKINITVPVWPISSTGTIFYNGTEEIELNWEQNTATIFTDELHSFGNDTNNFRWTINIFCG